MKRNPYQITVKKIYPLIFWQDCDICKMQFRREYAFKVRERTVDKKAFQVDRSFYFCNSCTANEAQALIALETMKSHIGRKREAFENAITSADVRAAIKLEPQTTFSITGKPFNPHADE